MQDKTLLNFSACRKNDQKSNQTTNSNTPKKIQSKRNRIKAIWTNAMKGLQKKGFRQTRKIENPLQLYIYEVKKDVPLRS